MSDGFRDAVILFGTFVDSTWSVLHLRNDSLEIYFARTDQYPDPMRAPPIDAYGTAAYQYTEVSAPHLGTVHISVKPGDHLQPGSNVGWLEVLDERRPVIAGHEGDVAAVLVEEGSLVEHNWPLIALT